MAGRVAVNAVNIRIPAEDEKSSENYDYYGFLLKSIKLQLGTLVFYYYICNVKKSSLNPPADGCLASGPEAKVRATLRCRSLSLLCYRLPRHPIIHL